MCWKTIYVLTITTDDGYFIQINDIQLYTIASYIKADTKSIITMSMWGNVKRERCLIIAWFDIKQIKCFAYNTCNGNYFPFRLSYTCISNSK